MNCISSSGCDRVVIALPVDLANEVIIAVVQKQSNTLG